MTTSVMLRWWTVSVFLVLVFVTPRAQGQTTTTVPATAGAVAPASPGNAGRWAFDLLATVYADKHPLNADPLFQDLRAKDEATRRQAGGRLKALLLQLVADETNGRAKWVSLPYWGGGSENAARQAHKSLAEQIGKEAQGAEALDVAVWLLHEDRLAGSARAGLAVLCRTDAPRVKEEITRLLREPHPVQEVVVGALQETAKRQWKDLAPEVTALVTSYLTAERTAADEAAEGLEMGKLPAYKPEAAFTPELDRLLKDISAMVLPEVPATATWQRFVVKPETRPGQDPQDRTWHIDGWLIAQTAEEYQLVDAFGDERTLDKKHTTMEARSLAETAADYIAFRSAKPESGFPSMPLSRRGGLTGQFEARALSAPEALVAAWAFGRGDKKTAAAVLFSRLDDLPDQRWAREIVRDLLGHLYHQEMLERFSRDRDYATTLRYARHLSRPLFDGYEYQERAKALAEQLPKRQDDFKTLVLPTPAEWEKLKTTLDRPQQVRYMADRLRLLNCFQWGQPGGVNLSDPQTRQPQKSRDQPVEEVLNPYATLYGMKLTVRDLPILIPYLEDTDYLPTFSYWRDFHPSRNLFRVDQIVAEIIDDTAKRELTEFGAFREMTPATRKAHLDKLLAWCKANADKTEEDLLMDALRDAAGDREALAAGAGLAHLKSHKGTALLVGRMATMDDTWKGDLAEICYRLDDPATLDAARKWANAPQAGVKFWAAMILLKHGDKAKIEGLATLQVAVQGEGGTEFYPEALDVLLASGNEEASKLADGILETKDFRVEPWYPHGQIIKLLFLAGREACLKKMTAALASADVETARRAADVVAEWRKDKWSVDASAPADQQKAKFQEAAQWLQEQLALIRAGKPPAMDTDRPSLHRSRWQIDAP